jgi:UDP-N-acetylglucosamine--N-acetylmuramyl-(pentapeptide) pyrophosphoryl-undecaprenol N-acetylglucosamine transferase
MTRVVIAGGGTGGHLMPALAIAGALRERRPDVEPVLVGALRGVEAEILPQRSFRYHLLPAEPLYRRQWWRNVKWPLLLPRLWGACRMVLDTERPRLVVGTGGYAAGPVLLAARRRGIPIALQEQNAYPGMTTRWAARWARQLHLGFPEAEAHLRPGRDVQVFTLGNPIVPPDFTSRVGARVALGLPAEGSVVLVVGGSQGSRTINEAVAGLLDDRRLPGVSLLWGTGWTTHARFATYASPPAVQISPFWDPIAPAYAASDLVVGRAGAMTLAEITAWGLPSVLIPLPTAAADHQTPNATALEAAGAATHLPESGLTPAALAEAVSGILSDPKRHAEMAAAARRRGRPDAAAAIADRLLGLL